ASSPYVTSSLTPTPCRAGSPWAGSACCSSSWGSPGRRDAATWRPLVVTWPTCAETRSAQWRHEHPLQRHVLRRDRRQPDDPKEREAPLRVRRTPLSPPTS